MRELDRPLNNFTFRPNGTFFKGHGEAAAASLRVALGYSEREVPRDVYAEFRSVGVHVFRRKLGNSNISGLFIMHPVAGKCALVNHSEDIYRQRFSAAHEMAHAGNGDMVTLTLIQGVVNTFVVFLARIVSGMVARNDNGEVSQGTYFIVSLVLQIVFGFLASFIVMWFSRQREYRADAGAAKLVGAPKMIAALQRLKGAPSDLPKEMTAMGIASEAKDSLLSTHPTLDNRIERLKQM